MNDVELLAQAILKNSGNNGSNNSDENVKVLFSGSAKCGDDIPLTEKPNNFKALIFTFKNSAIRHSVTVPPFTLDIDVSIPIVNTTTTSKKDIDFICANVLKSTIGNKYTFRKLVIITETAVLSSDNTTEDISLLADYYTDFSCISVIGLK